MSVSLPAQAEDEAIHTLSLRDIASWDPGTGLAPNWTFRASVPALQRGLVWQPQQIEMLWDSILRGFPIGALVVCRKIESQNRKTVEGITHHLLDGQQRCNAIALGFTDPWSRATTAATTPEAKSILWLDLQSATDATSTRKFLTRVTTLAHPWGYTGNDKVDRLPTHRIREALSDIGLDPAGADYKRPWPVQLWPSAATTPIPLAWLLLAPCENQGAFWLDIAQRAAAVTFPWAERARRWLEDKSTTAAEQREDIFQGIGRAHATKIIALNAPPELLEISSQEKMAAESEDPISNIEHLFQRLNQQGTRLDGEELAYSMIKAYWPELADPIDEIATGLMPESRMVSIGVRAALAQESAGHLPAAMTISALRAVAQGHDPRKQAIYDFIFNRLAGACAQVSTWLSYHPEKNPSGLLPVHITSIALGSPDVYLLLLCFAERLRRADNTTGQDPHWPKVMQALATVLHWFAEDKPAAANRVQASCQNELTIGKIELAVQACISAGIIHPIHTPEAVEGFVQLPKVELEKWHWWLLTQSTGDAEGNEIRRKSWEDFLNFRSNRELLLYAQRAFLARRFPDYNPARKDLWADHNRPWDFDHILAWKYIYHRKDGGAFREVCNQWGYTIGNFRAWPFEDNRSDQAIVAEAKIEGDAGRLADSFLLPGEERGFSGGDEVRRNEAVARKFVETCRERLLRIYRTWYESVGVAVMIGANDKLAIATQTASANVSEPSPMNPTLA